MILVHPVEVAVALQYQCIFMSGIYRKGEGKMVRKLYSFIESTKGYNGFEALTIKYSYAIIIT